MDAFAQQTAAAEEAQFTAALADAKEHSRSQADSQNASSEPPRRAPQNAAYRSSSAQSMREAALAKLAKARKYVAANEDALSLSQRGLTLSSQPEPGAVAQPQSATASPIQAAEWGKSAAGSSQQVLALLAERLPSAYSAQKAHR